MANTYDKASLVLIPSGTKEGTIFSQKPTNGDGDFTFSRSTSATRVGPSGYIEKETQNLLLQSNSFNTTWANSNSTETGGQSGYDGSSDAWLFSKSAATGYIYQNATTNGVATFSVYAKAGSLNWIRVQVIDASGNPNTFFDLQNGLIGVSGGVNRVASNLEDIGGGWYRCSITYNATQTQVRIYPADGNNDVSGTSGSIYIQDAQLEQGLVARDYIETTTSAVYGGITDNIPRLDYNGSCPSLLLEPQRTNLIPHSEYFGSGSGWSYFNNVSVGNFVLSPEGKMNATELVFDGTTTGRLERTISGLTTGADYSVSLYARVASGTQNVFFGSYQSEVFTLTTEWQRLERTQPINDTVAYPRIVCDDVATIEIWGFQLEQGSYATSYIPTYGSAVTRNKDFCYDAGNTATFNSTQGVFYFEGSALADDGTNRFLSLSDGTTNNYIYFRYVSTSNQYLFRTQIGGVTINTLSAYLADTTENHKFAFKFKSGDYAMWVDGVEISTDTSSTIFAPNVLSNMEFSFPTDGGGGFPSKTKQIMVFNTALTDEELAALTTI